MTEPLFREKQYPHLVAFLRSGGKLIIGEDQRVGSFASIQLDRTTRTFQTMDYENFDAVLKAMDFQAQAYADENW